MKRAEWLLASACEILLKLSENRIDVPYPTTGNIG